MIPLKKLPNRKQCPLANCGTCLPKMEEISFNNVFKGYPPIKVEVPYCRKYNISLATLEEIAYVELKSCELLLQDRSDKNIRLTSNEVNTIRKCLGLTRLEVTGLLSNDRYEYKQALLSLVKEQITLYEA